MKVKPWMLHKSYDELTSFVRERLKEVACQAAEKNVAAFVVSLNTLVASPLSVPMKTVLHRVLSTIDRVDANGKEYVLYMVRRSSHNSRLYYHYVRSDKLHERMRIDQTEL